MTKNKLVFLSDIHIGSNRPTNWYQASVHESYLRAALEYVVAAKNSIRELILLGDLIDFWTYVPSETPPVFAGYDERPNTIAYQNRGIFGDVPRGIIGLLGEAAGAVGKCSFVHGNHDMTVTQDLLNRIPTRGPSIILQPNFYFPLGTSNRGVVCTHGHEFSMMCAPYSEAANPISPLPVGYYATRAGAYYADLQLKKNNKQNVAELPNTGEPTGTRISVWDATKILVETAFESVGYGIMATIQAGTGLDWYTPILMPNGYQPRSLDQAVHDFKHLFKTFEQKIGPDGEALGRIGAMKALLLPDVDNNLTSYAAQLANANNARVVVLGHTHVPEENEKLRILQRQGDAAPTPFVYVNSGFNCSSVPDMQNSGKAPTFAEVEVDETNQRYIVALRVVERVGDNYRVATEPLMGPLSLPIG